MTSRQAGALLVVAALLALPLASGLPAAARFTVTLEAPARAGTNALYVVQGDVRLASYIPVGALNVSIFENGRYVGSAGTMLGGTYFATIKAPPTAGNITLVARVFNNHTLKAQSAPVTVTIYPPPEPPAALEATVAISSSAVLTWTPPAETYGDLDAYVVWRKLADGPWHYAHRAPPHILSWEDPVPAWGQPVEYRVTARSDAGDSAPANVSLAMPDDPMTGASSIDVPWIYVCDRWTNECSFAEPGNYTITRPAVRIEPFVWGTARHSNGDPVPQTTLTIHLEARWSCDGCAETKVVRSSNVKTENDGDFRRKFDNAVIWDDVSTMGGCRTIVFDALGFDQLLSVDGDAHYRFCA